MQNQNNYISLNIPSSLKVPNVICMKAPFLTVCPAKRKVAAKRWLLMYLREQSGHKTVGTNDSEYVTKFLHRNIMGLGKSFSKQKKAAGF